MGKLKKKLSKRKTLKQKYKVESKVKEHKRKVKRQAKKQRTFGLVKKRKKAWLTPLGLGKQDDYIPNLFPFKEQVINAIERRKQRDQEQQKAAFLRKKLNQGPIPEGDIQGFARQVNNEIAEFSHRKRSEQEKTLAPFATKQLSKKAHLKQLEKVLTNSDVIVEVLDARDPLGCRSQQIESRVLNASKKLILLLNKIDLVPPENVKAWYDYLSDDHPTIIFKSNTQSTGARMPRSAALDMSQDEKRTLSYLKRYSSSSLSLGGENLLKQVKKDLQPGQAVTVGIIGYPNVGKSSLINSLKQEAVAGVSSTPGFTTSASQIVLEQRVKLMDCPGVVFGKHDPHSLILRNVVRAEDLDDPVTSVEAMVARVPKENLLMGLEIADYDGGVRELLERVAVRRGFLKQKGVMDLERAAKAVLQAWNEGKIAYWSKVPNNWEDVVG